MLCGGGKHKFTLIIIIKACQIIIQAISWPPLSISPSPGITSITPWLFLCRYKIKITPWYVWQILDDYSLHDKPEHIYNIYKYDWGIWWKAEPVYQ